MSTRINTCACGLAMLLLLASGTGLAQQSILDDPARPEAERTRDAGSKPLQVYDFFGVAPGMTILDFIPGGGYNTVLLSKVVGPEGRVFSGPDRRGNVAQRVSAAGDVMANVTVLSDMDALEPDSLDVVVTVRNVHDLEGRGLGEGTYAALLAALKPGGILGVVDARTPKQGYDDSTHRINEQTVIGRLTDAGFELVDSSDLLANPNDDFGKYEGMSTRVEVDRMVLRFRKPQQ